MHILLRSLAILLEFWVIVGAVIFILPLKPIFAYSASVTAVGTITVLTMYVIWPMGWHIVGVCRIMCGIVGRGQ